MNIGRDLNLVIPVDGATGRFYVHSTPISSAAFEQYFLVLSKVYSTFDTERIWSTAPRICSMLLKQVAQNTGRGDGRSWWEGMDGVENGLLNEIRRLTSVVQPTQSGGWATVPFAEATRSMDPEDVADVESLLAFFTSLSASPLRREGRRALVERLMGALDAQLVSSNCTEYAASLQTSPATDSSGGTAST